jgi:hypothetical protein
MHSRVTCSTAASGQTAYPSRQRERENEVLPTLEERGIGFVPFSPLGRGFLTGTINDTTTFQSGNFRTGLPRFLPEARRINQELIDIIRAIPASMMFSPAQIALASLLAQKPWKQFRCRTWSRVGVPDSGFEAQDARAVQRSFLPFMPIGKAKPTRWRDIPLPGSRFFSISAAASA